MSGPLDVSGTWRFRVKCFSQVQALLQ